MTETTTTTFQDWDKADEIFFDNPFLKSFVVDDSEYDEATGAHIYFDEFGGIARIYLNGSVDLSQWVPDANHPTLFDEAHPDDFDADEIDGGDPYDIEYDI